MPLDIEGVVDRCVRLEETLCRLLTLEALHLPLTPSNDEMGILSAIVVA